MHHCRELLTECAASKTDKIPSLVPLLWPLLWYRATLDLTDSSAQQAKTTQKNEPVQSCPVPVEPSGAAAGLQPLLSLELGRDL